MKTGKYLDLAMINLVKEIQDKLKEMIDKEKTLPKLGIEKGSKK